MRSSDHSRRRQAWGLGGGVVAGLAAIAVLGSGVSAAVPSSTALHDDAVAAAVAASQQLAAGQKVGDVARAAVARTSGGTRNSAMVQGTAVLADSGPPPSVPAYALAAASAGQDVRLVVTVGGADRLVVVVPVAVAPAAARRPASVRPLVIVSEPVKAAGVGGAVLAVVVGAVLVVAGFALSATMWSRPRRGRTAAPPGAEPSVPPPPPPPPPGPQRPFGPPG